MAERDVAPLVARVSEVVAARLEEIAAEAGVSYHTLYAWGRGRRNASARHLVRLAEVVRQRAGMLQELASELEAHAATLTPAPVRGNGSGRRVHGSGNDGRRNVAAQMVAATPGAGERAGDPPG